jgi:acyl dehydratase
MGGVSNEFARAIDDRYFEDYVVGAAYEFPERVGVDEQEIIAFGRSFDPQSFHVDPEAAAGGPFHGLIASGWHTAGLMMRLYAKYYLSHVASLGGPGVDELRWLVPVRPGDELRLRTTVLEARLSRSKPDRGLVRTLAELLNQDDAVVLRVEALNFLAVR